MRTLTPGACFIDRGVEILGPHVEEQVALGALQKSSEALQAGLTLHGRNGEHAGRRTKEQRGGQNYRSRSRLAGQKDTSLEPRRHNAPARSRRVYQSDRLANPASRGASPLPLSAIRRQFQQIFTKTPANRSQRPGAVAREEAFGDNPQARMIS